MLRGNLHGRLALKWCGGRKHLEENDAERIEVSASIHLVSHDLLGRHVVGSADGRARPGEPHLSLPLLGDDLDQAKVGQQEATLLRQQNIGGFDGGMDYAARVGKIEGGGQLFQVVDDLWQDKLPLALHDIAQGTTADIRHNKIGQPIALAIFVDGHNIGVFEGSSGISFTPEAFEEGG